MSITCISASHFYISLATAPFLGDFKTSRAPIGRAKQTEQKQRAVHTAKWNAVTHLSGTTAGENVMCALA